MSMFDGYIICGTPRTGSTLLCDLLASTKRTGEPDSFFRRQSISWWAEQWGLRGIDAMDAKDFSATYLELAVRAGKGATDIFGLRLMRENLVDLDRMIDLVHPRLSSDRARLEAAFGSLLYIHLFREDKLAQAVSLVKAEQTGLWHVAPDGTEIERLTPSQEPQYDFVRLRRQIAEMECHDAAWMSWFDEQGIEPLHVSYEGLSADPTGTLIRVCDALGVPVPNARDIKPGVARLSDETSSEWMRRYILENASVS